MTGIYVHIPYCRSKCIYCDFYSQPACNPDWDSLVNALLREARERMPGYAAGEKEGFTIYIGGGTPSLMDLPAFRKLASGLHALTGALPVREFTLEVNPDDVTQEKAAGWAGCGVGRISMGVQSLVDVELRAIGRRHNAAEAISAYGVLRNRFDNISLDLMFGLPLQSLESLAATLDGIGKLRPEHISAYSLMYEERTALTKLRDAGRITEAAEDTSTGMFRLINRTLAERGYSRYELSNYSLPGREAVHNSLYWCGAPYIGIGPGAHSYDGDSLRTANPPDTTGYLRKWNGNEGDWQPETETLTPEIKREEMIMTRLRTRQGLDLREYGEKFGTAERCKIENSARRWITGGLMNGTHGATLVLSDEGVMISDEIIVSLL